MKNHIIQQGGYNMKTIYLDHAATTPINEDVLKAMFQYITENYVNDY